MCITIIIINRCNALQVSALGRRRVVNNFQQMKM